MKEPIAAIAASNLLKDRSKDPVISAPSPNTRHSAGEGPETKLTEITLSQQMSKIARRLRTESQSTESVLKAITAAAVEAVPGAAAASVTLVNGKLQVTTPVAIGEIARECDVLQQELGEGPCIRAATQESTVRIDDMHNEERWPRFSDAASDLGVRSMLCFTLYVDNDNFGALNLHAMESFVFDDDAESIGSLFAAHAAIAFAAVREKEQMRAALTNRDIIGQAKGMIMERYKLDADAAFRLLARLSQDSNVKLSEIALRVVEVGPE